MAELEIKLIPILDDNYVFLILHKVSGKAVLVDPGDSEPCLRSLKRLNQKLDYILITHHHADHIAGIAELKEQFPEAQVYAPKKNKSQIPDANFYLNDGDRIELAGVGDFEVLGVPGHTLGHIAYYLKSEKALFSGDVLFGLSCGRLFEGSFEIAFATLQKLKKLPNETRVFCTHEYTMSNLRFMEELIETQRISSGYDVAAFDKYKKDLLDKRSKKLPSVPLSLGKEKVSNPMLFAENVEEFSRLRQLRNVFKASKQP